MKIRTLTSLVVWLAFVCIFSGSATASEDETEAELKSRIYPDANAPTPYSVSIEFTRYAPQFTPGAPPQIKKGKLTDAKILRKDGVYTNVIECSMGSIPLFLIKSIEWKPPGFALSFIFSFSLNDVSFTRYQTVKEDQYLVGKGMPDERDNKIGLNGGSFPGLVEFVLNERVRKIVEVYQIKERSQSLLKTKEANMPPASPPPDVFDMPKTDGNIASANPKPRIYRVDQKLIMGRWLQQWECSDSSNKCVEAPKGKRGFTWEFFENGYYRAFYINPFHGGKWRIVESKLFLDDMRRFSARSNYEEFDMTGTPSIRRSTIYQLDQKNLWMQYDDGDERSGKYVRIN
jgi:hypothetical protein